MNQLIAACRLLTEANRRGNMVDFWRAIALIEQALKKIDDVAAENAAKVIQTEGD
jgi:hypothetical protein